MTDDLRIGGVGADGCECAIRIGKFCPIHGDDEFLSPRGRELKEQERARTESAALERRAFVDWLDRNDGCPTCGAAVHGRQARVRHAIFHGHRLTDEEVTR